MGHGGKKDKALKHSVDATANPPTSYRVKLISCPIVVDGNGEPVPNSHVIEITFAGDSIETMLGRENTIVGPGVAKIQVGDIRIRGVPLC